ncbi:hypothetical protein NP493_308g03123 [Ridgeia piscesae]|uniref:Fibronectin type-III domain-containing protein n=1 Tax=Ridgeia piscesae TaxID=27915 RepID=A0AAD9NW46_RIDPI|nr:hypothetical protein NP493_308g03123 [Ridgeia piscesae]
MTLCQKSTFPGKTNIVVRKENMLELSWFGSDDESGISAYDVGLSSTGSEDMDLLPYTSTHGHRHFITYHPDLMDGQTFYIHIRAVNRAGQQTVQVVGPVMVQVDAPTFSGDIDVCTRRYHGVLYLVATWNSSSLSPAVSRGYLYSYSYAVGHSRGADNVKSFSQLTEGSSVPRLCTWTTPPTCVATPVGDLQWRLHGRHSYYVTLKLEGVNGLERVVSSDEYEHYIGPPSGGVVVEIPVNTTELMSEDIDLQSSMSHLHVAWFGFQHVDQPVSYELAVGTAPGNDDVVGFKHVGALSKRITNLALQPFKTYFATIRAKTLDGSTVVSSDGVTIFPVDTELLGVTVFDALPCLTHDSQHPHAQIHHDTPFVDQQCEVDVDFQMSITYLGIGWSLPANVEAIITNILWGIQEHNSRILSSVREITDAGRVSHVIATDLHLEPGHTYRAVVKFCHPGGCFLPLHSDGVTITPDAPVSSGFTAVTMDDTKITFSWAQFVDPSVKPMTADVISRHEWTLMVKHPDRHSTEQLYPWRKITGINCVTSESSNNKLCSSSVRLEAPLEGTSCIVLAVRAHSIVGLYSTITRHMSGCDHASSVKLTVIDAVGTKLNGDISLKKNARWPVSDREYTPSKTTLSAVWPDLRHGTYAWKVFSDRAIHRFAFVKPRAAPDYGDFDCSAPEVLACGETQENFVNVHDLPLQEGQRYYICILANATDLKFEKFTQHLEHRTDCSNGIVVDSTPPFPGRVWIGSHSNHWSYQISRSQMNIYWSSFIDVETYGQSSHHSGIVKYEYAIGTSPDGVDVQDYTDVGVTNMAVATRLTLRDGSTYFVTVRATDHVGRSTTAQSAGITIDSTEPEVRSVPINVGGSYSTVRTEFSAAWKNVFVDPENGIQFYYWCLGSKAGYCDTMPYMKTTETKASTKLDQLHHFADGLPVYVSVQAVNRVGLTAVATSRAVIVDASPPAAGHVYDVIDDTQTTDVDYTTVSTKIGATWSGFHDPHSHVTGYSVNIGKCPSCGDILETSHVGIATNILLDHVTMERGVTYYTTIEACNGAGLCVSVTSDGVIADTSPPVGGVVFDGIATEDMDYQSSKSMLSAHWLNFHDPESGLLYMEWWAGTTPGRSDILAPTRLHVTDRASAQISQPLPLNKNIYITLKVFNKAGLSTEKTSNGFKVDTTSPVATTRVSLNRAFGSLKTKLLVWTSSLSVLWKVTDPESSVVEQFVSVTTRDSIHHNVPAVKLYGDVQEYTFSNLTLVDGEIYYVRVIACNGARLCTTSVSEGILVDATPPIAGAFAIETAHAAALTRHRRGWMTYHNNVLRLAWLGFNDAHTDVTTYYVTVGTKYGAANLLGGNKPILFVPTSEDMHTDEGFVQKANVTVTSTIQRNQQLYISIWAENQVGLMSSRLHGTFTAVPSQSAAGTLALVRRCQPVTCEGHCTCAPHGHWKCSSTRRCTNVKGKSDYQRLTVYDIEDYTVSAASNARDIDVTRSQCALAATWRTAATSGKAPERYEWSVGVDGEQIGHDLLDVLREPLWREASYKNMAVYTTGSSRKTDVILESHTNYMLYVRAWYDANSYAVYMTDGVQTDSSPPELSRASKVTEQRSFTSSSDVDFTTSKTNVTLSWSGVFRDSHAAIRRYVAAISRHLGGRDVAEKQLASTVTQTVLSGLTLDVSCMYYSTVVAYNDAGLFRSAYSDGFKVDVSPPVTGHVWDGRSLTDQDYSSDNLTVSAWWRGFSDDESYIDHYEWCVGTEPGKDDVVTCRDVGLHTRSTTPLSSVMQPGSRLFSTVYAYNGAGLKATAVSSDGYIIDSTPPRSLHKFQLGRNLLKNPSFQRDVDRTAGIPTDWNGQGTFLIANSRGGINAQDAQTFLDIVSGYVEQTVPTVKSTKYRVTFYVRAPDSVRFHSQQIGFVQLTHVHRAFSVEPTTTSSGDSWQKHVYYFTASGANSAVRIGSVGHKTGFLLDDVTVQEIGLGRRSPATDPKDPVSSHVQPMHVHVTSRGSYTAVTAAWDVEDPESPVTGHSWAIGTVRGGVQLQNFRSVGRQTHACADGLLLQHGTEVHVTVVTENAAGLKTAIYSDPWKVDLTPPDLCCLVDGGSEKDISSQTARNLSITWSVRDAESDIKYCEWALGKSPGSQEVQSFTRTTSLSTASVALDASVSHGETVFSVVRCFNYASLQSTLVSSGVVMVTDSPDVSMATLTAITSSASYYPSRDSHQSDRDHLFFGWEGVRDKSGISGYEVSLQAKNAVPILPWTTILSSTEMFAELQGLPLESYATYTLMMRVYNSAHLKSNVIVSNITIETEPPHVTVVPLTSQWPQKWELKLDWTGMFISNSSLLYEISIGTTRGGADVQRAIETGQSRFRINGVDHAKEHHVTLTAFNKAGLYTTGTFVVAYSHTSDAG